MNSVEWSRVRVALSVRQPWAWLLVNGIKDVENRSWATGFRGPVLIHAGKKWGREEKEDAEAIKEEFEIELPETFELGGIVGGAVISDCVTKSASRWFVGDYGFVMRDAVVLPFRPVRGMLGFFNVVGDQSFGVKEVAQ